MEEESKNNDYRKLWQKLYDLDQEKVKIVLFGQPGAGKSSTINALCGEKMAKTSNQTDTTIDLQIIEHNKLIFIDLPGYGTEKFPAEDFFTKFKPLQYDLFLCLFSGKLHDADVEFFKSVYDLAKPCIFVRNKTDEIYDDEKTLKESKEDIRCDLARKIGLSKDKLDLVFISARSDLLDGIDELSVIIESKMDEARKEKYIMAIKSYSEKQLLIKKEVCDGYVKKTSYLAVANNLNPLFGVDIAVDLGLLFKMFLDIRSAFQITEKIIKESSISKSDKNYLASGLTKEGVKMLLKSFGVRYALKSTFKYIPIVGQIVGVPLSYKIVKDAGERYLEICYKVASESLDKNLVK